MMRPLWLSEIASACKGELMGLDLQVTAISTDSRETGSDRLFVALKGERFDAHQFVPGLTEKEFAAVVVSSPCDTSLPQIRVADTELALGALGALNRSLFSGPVVAITGSGGKTSVKEMLALALRTHLSSDKAVLATQGNLNNQIGAPLTLLRLNPEHQVAVVELGASGIGEIAYTVNLTQPQISILNNALPAHVEGFGSLENIVIAKSEIYDGLSAGGIGIVNIDDPNASYWLDKLDRLGRQILTFGTHPEAELRASDLELQPDGTFRFTLSKDSESVSIKLSVMGRHMVLNALSAAAAWVSLGYALTDFVPGLEQYSGFKGRLQTTQLGSGTRLIDDSYNANPASMRAALDVLATLPGKHIAVLGHMAELGETELEEHQSLGAYVAQKQVDTLLTLGELTEHTFSAASSAGVNGHHFTDLADLKRQLTTLLEPGAVVLVKGSRSAGLDRLVDWLKEDS